MNLNMSLQQKAPFRVIMGSSDGPGFPRTTRPQTQPSVCTQSGPSRFTKSSPNPTDASYGISPRSFKSRRPTLRQPETSESIPIDGVQVRLSGRFLDEGLQERIRGLQPLLGFLAVGDVERGAQDLLRRAAGSRANSVSRTSSQRHWPSARFARYSYSMTSLSSAVANRSRASRTWFRSSAWILSSRKLKPGWLSCSIVWPMKSAARRFA